MNTVAIIVPTLLFGMSVFHERWCRHKADMARLDLETRRVGMEHESEMERLEVAAAEIAAVVLQANGNTAGYVDPFEDTSDPTDDLIPRDAYLPFTDEDGPWVGVSSAGVESGVGGYGE